MDEPEAGAAEAGVAEAGVAEAGRLDLAAAIRALRRRADVSQRELAASSGTPAATVARIESGRSPDPKLHTVERLVRAAGARLAIVDLDGSEPVPLATDGWRDGAQRRYPPHLDPGPVNRWRRGRAEDVVSFYRSRWWRDAVRRDRAGERSWDMFTEIRRLGPGDAAILATLRQQAAEFSLAAERPKPAGRPLTGQEALCYLRDPSLRHWVADHGGRVYGHLAAWLHRHYAGSSSMVVTEFGLRPEHRAGVLGRLLLLAALKEADRCGADDFRVLARDPATARYLRGLGFVRRGRRPILLTVPD